MKHNWTDGDINRIAQEINASIEARRERTEAEAALPIDAADLELDAMLAEGKPMDGRRYKHLTRMLDLLTTIHGEIADEVNANREALREVFSRLEDRYYPLDGSSVLQLSLDVHKQEQRRVLP